MPSLDSECGSRASTQVIHASSPPSHSNTAHRSTDFDRSASLQASSVPSRVHNSNSSIGTSKQNLQSRSTKMSPSHSPAISPLPSPLPTRPRHHSRSVSQEAARFTSTMETFHLSPPRRPSANSTHISFRPAGTTTSSASSSQSTTPVGSTTPLASPSAPLSPSRSTASIAAKASSATSTTASTTTAKQSPRQSLPAFTVPSRASTTSAASSATASPDSDDASAQTVSTAPSSADTSPERRKVAVAVPVPSAKGTQETAIVALSPGSLASLPSDDETRLQHLLQLQAARRPKLLRLTPAFASLPGRLPAGSGGSKPSQSAAEAVSSGAVAFPKMASTSSPVPGTTADQRKNLIKDGDKIQPPSGLLSLDMSNLPTPSPRDSTAPQSTSDLPEVRTKSGRLIKPSLKHSGSTNWSPATATGRSESGPSSVPGSLRAKSTPNTPSVPKVVQFDSQLERVKVFKFKQRPTAISRSGSPEQTETETEEERELFPFVNYGRRNTSPPTSGFATPSSVSSGVAGIGNVGGVAGATEAEEQLVLRLPNFPSSARLTVDREVFLERIYLADDLRSVRGTVRVKNISFEKWVAVRFTLDSWVTVNEVSAEYSESLADGQSDRFSFSIKLNELLNWPRGAGQHESKTMFLCLRYTTGNGEFWDNNDNLNYQLDFRKRQLPSTPTPTPSIVRPSSRSQTISGPAATAQQARIIEMAKRNGVQAGKVGAFVDDLRRELDKLRSDGEEDDRPPVVTKKMLADVAIAKQLGANQRDSPPLSPGGRRSATSPMWSSRYDWGESLRNSSSTNSRNRPSAYDYFNAKPPPAVAAAMMHHTGSSEGSPQSQAAAGHSHVDGSLAVPDSNSNSAEVTPQIRAFGQTRSGMFSPAVGDVIAHHQPINSSVESSAASSPLKLSDEASAVSRGHRGFKDGRGSPADGSSPVPRGGQGGNSKYFSFPPVRRGASSPYEPSSLDGSDEEEDQASPQYSRSPAVRISTLPRTSLKASLVMKPSKDDGIVLENYDHHERISSPGQGSPPSPFIFSPSASISSVESEAATDVTFTEDSHPNQDGSNTDKSDHSTKGSPTTSLPPRLAARRRWSPTSSNASSPGNALNNVHSASKDTSYPATAAPVLHAPHASSHERNRPRSAAELSELIQKYCWSNEITPGTAPLPDSNSASAAKPGLGLPEREVTDLVSSYNLSSPPISGAATPTLDL